MIPLTINNSWKMTKWGNFPMGIGNKIIVTIHDAIPVNSMPFAELFERTEKTVVGSIN